MQGQEFRRYSCVCSSDHTNVQQVRSAFSGSSGLRNVRISDHRQRCPCLCCSHALEAWAISRPSEGPAIRTEQHPGRKICHPYPAGLLLDMIITAQRLGHRGINADGNALGLRQEHGEKELNEQIKRAGNLLPYNSLIHIHMIWKARAS